MRFWIPYPDYPVMKIFQLYYDYFQEEIDACFIFSQSSVIIYSFPLIFFEYSMHTFVPRIQIWDPGTETRPRSQLKHQIQIQNTTHRTR